MKIIKIFKKLSRLKNLDKGLYKFKKKPTM